ncbi:MAG TPA: CDP-alcohol phosphatidyltransferase family protein [Chlamydiales bacterium]|nr:CDP-alcohol phosphatidyltransferase family protein [Chlamydiales bacterium]
MKRVYLVPNVITAFSLACGLFVIFKINMIEPGSGNYEVILTSAILLLVAAIADFMDGAIARVIHAESDFGFNFDSLADAVTFGVAPSVLLLKSLSLEQGTFLSFFTATGVMVYSLCGVLRLARYMVKARQSEDNPEEKAAQKKHFTGLPIPAGAAGAVSANLFFLSPILPEWAHIEDGTRAIVLSCVMILLGYLMVSRWKFPRLKMLHFHVPSFPLVFLTVVITVFVLYGIFHYFSIVLAILSWTYILVALILSIIRIIAGKKSKTLEEFEPEPDDFEEL